MIKRLSIQNSKGFTLIELLVVVAIISMLSSIVLSTVSDARAKARDRALIQQIRQVQTALELYRQKYGEYPDGNPLVIGERYSWNCNLGSDGVWSGNCGAVVNLSDRLSEFLPGGLTPPKNGSINYRHIKARNPPQDNQQWCSDDLSPTILPSGYDQWVGRSGAPDYTISVTFETDYKKIFPVFIWNNVAPTASAPSCFSII